MVSVDALVQYRRDISERRFQKADASTQEHSQQNQVEGHLALVIYIARSYQNTGMDLMDLIGEGNLGLLRAAQKFDPDQGVKFSTYAAYWIKQAILAALPQRISSLSCSDYKFQRLQRLLRTQQQMQEEAGQEPTLAQLAAQMETSIGSVLALLNLQQGMQTASIDVQTGEHEEDTLANLLEANPEQTPEHVAFLKVRNEQIQSLLLLLTKAEREVILLRYGLKDGKEYSQSAVATITKKDWRTVARIEQRALLKMRRLAMLRQLQDFVD